MKRGVLWPVTSHLDDTPQHDIMLLVGNFNMKVNGKWQGLEIKT